MDESSIEQKVITYKNNFKITIDRLLLGFSKVNQLYRVI